MKMERGRPSQDTKYFGKTYTVVAGIGRKILHTTRKIIQVTNKKLNISPTEWDLDWANSLGPGTNIRPQCEDFEYQFSVGDLVKVAPGFIQGKLQPGDVGVITKKIVMYCHQVKSDGPAYKVAWQKDRIEPTEMREFKLVPAFKRG